jgi:hypothetical protein
LESIFAVAVSLAGPNESIWSKKCFGRIGKVKTPFVETGLTFGFIPFEIHA